MKLCGSDNRYTTAPQRKVLQCLPISRYVLVDRILP